MLVSCGIASLCVQYLVKGAGVLFLLNLMTSYIWQNETPYPERTLDFVACERSLMQAKNNAGHITDPLWQAYSRLYLPRVIASTLQSHSLCSAVKEGISPICHLVAHADITQFSDQLVVVHFIKGFIEIQHARNHFVTLVEFDRYIGYELYKLGLSWGLKPCCLLERVIVFFHIAH